MKNADKTCTALDCTKPVRCVGLCKVHYAARWLDRTRTAGVCRTCGKRQHARGMCEYHYRKFLKTEEMRPELERARADAAHPLRKKWYALLSAGAIDEWHDFATFTAAVVMPNASGDEKFFLRKKRTVEPFGPDNYRWVARRTPAEHKEVAREGRARAYYSRVISGEPVYSRASRNSILKRTFGISVDEYDVMFDLQKGLCAICNGEDSKRLAVDHCHKTNKVRGLLCQSCNLSIGRMGDDPDRLRRAAEYIESHRKLRLVVC